jgi:hypothetical protein
MRRQELQHLYVEMTLDSMLLEELQMFVADTISKQLDTLNNEQMISEFTNRSAIHQKTCMK